MKFLKCLLKRKVSNCIIIANIKKNRKALRQKINQEKGHLSREEGRKGNFKRKFLSGKGRNVQIKKKGFLG